jgi:hypothetical protein
MVDLREQLSNPLLRASIRDAARLVERAAAAEPFHRAVQKPPRRAWRVSERLTETVLDELRAHYERGTPKPKLAADYDISLSSVKRLIRKRHWQLSGPPRL